MQKTDKVETFHALHDKFALLTSIILIVEQEVVIRELLERFGSYLYKAFIRR